MVDSELKASGGKKRPAPAPAPTPAPDALIALPTCSTGVMGAFSKAAMELTSEGSDAYRVPGAPRLIALQTSIASLLAGDAANALSWATSAEYTLCRGEGAEAALALWKPPPGEGQAQLVVRTGTARGAIFEAPHPLHDIGTMEQAKYLFERLNGRALIASGTHRCASLAGSACSGTTAACGTSGEAFRLSDMAHNEDTAFHTAHRALSEHFTSDWVFGIHGMASPGASVSDGTTQKTSPDAPSARVAAALAKRFSDVTTCNAFGGVPYASRLCGTTDVQGRHLNGATPECTTAAPASSGRFIHLEQSRTVRDGRVLVGDAIDSVLP